MSFPLIPRNAFKQRHGFWLTLGMLGAIGFMFIVVGSDGLRIAKMTILLLPALAWMCWPIHNRCANQLRTVFVWGWVMLFVVDGALRGFLLDAYRSAPDGALVLGAVANTNLREGSEYLSTYWRSVSLWIGAVLVAGAIASPLVTSVSLVSVAPRGWIKIVLYVMLTLCALAFASKPWRRLHPVAFWSEWGQSVQALRASWSDQQRWRERTHTLARSAAPTVSREGSSTVVLVITDSINRDNMSLYGYARPTTPQLVANQQQLGEQMTVLRNAWSVDASTIPSLKNMFSFGEPDAPDSQHLIALARAAGYKVWWMSNHDDVAIEQRHARMADVVEMVNRTPGRSSASLDGELLDCVQEALRDVAQRKFIVVHLLGAHPHYKLRFPSGDNPFDDESDAVDSALANQGRSMMTRHFRQEYDAALRYHDSVVAETLRLTRSEPRSSGYRAWMYLSDHGQEVGHVSDRVGHSPNTESGYRIPSIVWRNQGSAIPSVRTTERPFRADWAAWTVAELLGLNWQGRSPARDVLSSEYRWTAPTLPIRVNSFVD